MAARLHSARMERSGKFLYLVCWVDLPRDPPKTSAEGVPGDTLFFMLSECSRAAMKSVTFSVTMSHRTRSSYCHAKMSTGTPANGKGRRLVFVETSVSLPF